MLIINNIEQQITIPKSILNDSKMFTMIIQHNYTRKYWVLDYADESENRLFHKFTFEVQEGMPKGEYTYYIIPYNSTYEYDVDISDIRNTCVINYDTYNPIAVYNNPLAVSDSIIVVFDESGSTPNEECTKINVLQTGLLRINSHKDFNFYTNHRTYKGYEQRDESAE